MDTRSIYEEAKNKAFERIRLQRDAHAPDPVETDTDIETLFNQKLFVVDNNEERRYSINLNAIKHHSFNMFCEIIFQLLNKYGIPFKTVKRNPRVHNVLSFVTLDNQMLYIIVSPEYIELGQQLIPELMKVYNAKSYKEVVMVYDDAYRLCFNYNTDENDPTRGTGLYSIRHLFETLFSFEEFTVFKEFENAYSQEVRQYLGYQIVKNLTPNALFNFKKTVEYSLLSLKPELELKLRSLISPKDVLVILTQFYTNHYYKALLGNNDFAKSYITAEWLYDSMKKAGKIDFSAVVMGYYKAVEQLLYAIVKLHIDEGRTINCEQNKQRYIDFSTQNLNKGLVNISLGSLIGFVSYTHHRDLFSPIIQNAPKTIEAVLKIIKSVKTDRNKYFHKVNIDSWDPLIEQTRESVSLVLLLLLGAFSFSDSDRKTLGVPDVTLERDYDKLCEYINYNASHLFYISEYGEELNPVFALQDKKIQIDEYGDPHFSGIYFRSIPGADADTKEISIADIDNGRIAVDESEMGFKEDSLPVVIYQGKRGYNKAGLTLSGPLYPIYENGVYTLPELKHKPEY